MSPLLLFYYFEYSSFIYYILIYNLIMNENAIIDPDLEDIRHFRGSVLQFTNFLKRRMEIDKNPHKKVNYEYPVKREEIDNSLPYQDFENGNSSYTKYLMKTRRKGFEKNEKLMEDFLESYEEYVNKLETSSINEDNPLSVYDDERDQYEGDFNKPEPSVQQKDYDARNDLSSIQNMLEEIIAISYDGFEFEEEQLKNIKEIKDNLSKLKTYLTTK